MTGHLLCHVCQLPGGLPGVSEIRIRGAGGRPPPDPATGRMVEPGTYGPWKKCRPCGIWLITDLTRCPCCRVVLSTRPRRAAVERNRRKAAERHRATAPAAAPAATAAASTERRRIRWPAQAAAAAPQMLKEVTRAA